jgi:hypothetical protein
VTWRLRARIEELEDISTARQRLDEHIPMVTNMQATKEELLETMFPVGTAPRLYNEEPRPAEGITESAECRVQLSSWSEAEKRRRSSSVEGTDGRQFWIRVAEGRTWEREAEESPLLEAVARNHWRRQAGWKRLSGCYGELWIVHISGSTVITCSSECVKSSYPIHTLSTVTQPKYMTIRYSSVHQSGKQSPSGVGEAFFWGSPIIWIV